MRLLLALALAVLFATSAYSGTLITPSFVIVIINNEPEGTVSSDNIFYVGVSKKSGDSVKIKGQTLHTMEADGVTPNRFLGYKFKKEDVTYFVSDHGHLTVTKGKKVIVDEAGNWVD